MKRIRYVHLVYRIGTDGTRIGLIKVCSSYRIAADLIIALLRENREADYEIVTERVMQ